MNTLTYKEEMEINQIIAREFIEEKLGIEATQANLALFVKHIITYEKEVAQFFNY